MVAQQADGQRQLVAVVDRAGLDEQRAGRPRRRRRARAGGPPARATRARVRVVRRPGCGRCRADRQVGGQGQEVGRGRALVLGPAEELDQRTDVARRVRERPVVLQRQALDGARRAGCRPRCRPRTRGSPGSPSSSAWSRISRSPKAWKVRMSVPACPYGTSRSTRACISSAARSVKVSARICSGRARLVAMSQAMRRVTTCVLPVPGPASTSRGPSPWVTAWRCWRSSPGRSPATTSRSIGRRGSELPAAGPADSDAGAGHAAILTPRRAS